MSLPLRYDSALADSPGHQDAIDIGFVFGGKGFLDLVILTPLVTFYYRCLIGIGKQRCEPLNIVIWLLQQLSDGDGVVETLRQSQQHWTVYLESL